MKKIDLGQTITILANLGVIAGIVFLAIELAQNNQLLEAQTRRERLDVRMTYNQYLLGNVNIGAIEYKLLESEPVTQEEEYHYFNYAFLSFAHWEWQFDEYLAGTISLEQVPADSWRRLVQSISIWHEAWDRYSSSPARTREFVSYMNEYVFD